LSEEDLNQLHSDSKLTITLQAMGGLFSSGGSSGLSGSSAPRAPPTVSASIKSDEFYVASVQRNVKWMCKQLL
jgi:hypothetical protein